MNTSLMAADILVVDDTPANLRLLFGMLTEQGYKVRSAPNGKLALMGVQASPPDLILLDITMPGMSGYQVCEQLKADPYTRDIPIIFISALDQTEDKVKAFALGGVDYVAKPFQIEEVLARVQTHLMLHALQRQLAAANQDLRAANAELQANNADLDAFAHTVAHDLKNPLSIMMGFSRLLEERFDQMETDEIVDCLHRITQTSYKMRDIINELLLLAGVRQMDQVQTGPLDMGKIVSEVLTRFEPQIQAAQADIVMPPGWPSAIGYAAWIEEVWANYLSNALKYGGRLDAGVRPRIELGYSIQHADQHPASRIRFWVRDSGPGLAPEAQKEVFKPFTRLHPRQAEGHGLGLSIVQRIVEKLGGQVGVTSAGMPGEGSEFWFTLPVEIVDKEKENKG